MKFKTKPEFTEKTSAQSMNRRTFLYSTATFVSTVSFFGFTLPIKSSKPYEDLAGPLKGKPRIVLNQRTKVIHAYQGTISTIAPKNLYLLSTDQLLFFLQNTKMATPELRTITSGKLRSREKMLQQDQKVPLESGRLYKPFHAVKCLALNLLKFKDPQRPDFENSTLEEALYLLSCIKREHEELYYLTAGLTCLRYEDDANTAFSILLGKFKNYEKARLNDREEFDRFFNRVVERENWDYRKRLVKRIQSA